MPVPNDSFDIEAATPVAATALAAGDRVGVDDTSANSGAGGWVAVELQTLLDGLLRVAAAADCVLTVDGTAGKLVVRQRSGTPGTDEMQVYHDGSLSWLYSKDGGIRLVVTGTSGAPVSICRADADMFPLILLDPNTSTVVGCLGYSGLWGVTPGAPSASAGAMSAVYGSGGATFLGSGGVHWLSGGTVSTGADTGLVRPAAGVVRVTDGSTGGGTMEFMEMTAPAAGDNNTARLYAEDNGSGKTRLVAKWADGSTSVVAIQP